MTNKDNMTYPTKPIPIEHKSQNEITAERREKRESILSGIVGSRREPLHFKYPEAHEMYYEEGFLDGHRRGYRLGYENGYEMGERDGGVNGIWKGLIGGIVISCSAVFVWLFIN